MLLVRVLHPYYKLAYIKHVWDGPEEQATEIAAGNPDAKDWQDVVRQIVEKTVAGASAHILSDFDKHCETLLKADMEEGWASEL